MDRAVIVGSSMKSPYRFKVSDRRSSNRAASLLRGWSGARIVYVRGGNACPWRLLHRAYPSLLPEGGIFFPLSNSRR